MKKLGYILILLLTLPLVGLAQNDSLINNENPKPILKDQLNLDVNLLGLGLTFNKPINDKYAFDFGIQGGFIFNYFILHTGGRNFASAYAEAVGAQIGVSNNSIRHLSFMGGIKIASPYSFERSNYKSPYVGLYFIAYYKVSSIVSIGTNIDMGVMSIENESLFSLSTSFIFLSIKIGK